MKTIRRLATSLCVALLFVSCIFINSAEASPAWSNYFKTCKPILINQFAPTLNQLFHDTNNLNLTAAKKDMNTSIALAGREASCAHSPDKVLNNKVSSLSTILAATMIVGEEFLNGSAKLASYEAGLSQLSPRWRQMASQLANDQAKFG